jgi:type IV pilus assembly protein PilO
VNRRALVLGLVASVVLLALWFVLLWGPLGGRLSKLEDREAAAETQNQELQLRLDRLRAAQDDAPALTADVDQLRRAIPDDPGLAQFLLDANDAASAAGVDFQSVSPSPPEASQVGGPPVIRLAINVSGTYFSIIDYLDRLEKLPRLVVVDNVTMTPSQDTDQVALALTARMFTTDVAALAAAPGTAPSTTPTTVPVSTQQPVTPPTTAPAQSTVSGSNG